MPHPAASLPLGVVIRRLPGVTRWQKYSWKAVAVLPGAAPADWVELRRDGEAVEFHAATRQLEMWPGETAAYLEALNAERPAVYVVLRPAEAGEHPFDVLLVTASTYEAQDFLDTGEEVVEPVLMPPGLIAWIRQFVEAHHEDETFVKRKRKNARTDKVEDGRGDPRIRQETDVYRAPRKRRLS